MNNSDNINIVPASIIVAGIIVAGAVLYQDPFIFSKFADKRTTTNSSSLIISWGNLGAQLVEVGVIDGDKFKAMYEGRGQFTSEYESLLFREDNKQLKITKNNASFVLNLLWALGLGNKSLILEKGEMSNPKYGGPQNFASTAGWTMAQGDAMSHYNMHSFIYLTDEQERLVAKVAKNIYRPCCSNSAYFPDCNHGMAMLGFLELMASQGFDEEKMYSNALALNSYWFPGYEQGQNSAGGCNV